MQLCMKHYLAGVASFAFLALTIPVSARTNKQSVDISKDTMIGSTQLKPGSYSLTADDAKKELEVRQNGKIVATVPGQWNKTPQKIKASLVTFDGDKVTEVQFGGSDQTFQLQ